MDEFTLAPWELPPGCDAPLSAPVDAQVEIEWEGRKRVLNLRYIKHKYVWLVFANFPHEANLGNRILLGQNTPWTLLPLKIPNEIVLARVAENIAQSQEIAGREWILGHYSHWGESRQVVFDFQKGGWVNDAWGHSCEFQLLENPPEMQQWKNSQIRQFLARQAETHLVTSILLSNCVMPITSSN